MLDAMSMIIHDKGNGPMNTVGAVRTCDSTSMAYHSNIEQYTAYVHHKSLQYLFKTISFMYTLCESHPLMHLVE
jgi:hypothetical protein